MLITELGYFALLTAFVLALLQVILPTIGVIRNQVAWQRRHGKGFGLAFFDALIDLRLQIH